MTHKTNGIVLRFVRYGETSIVVSVFTEKFGIQSYIVNGIRTVKGAAKASLFQPASILQMEVYHQSNKNLFRIKDYSRAYSTIQLFENVVKNCVALFMVELIYQLLKQPEPNEDLYQFTEASLLELDKATPAITANLPLFFALHLTHFLGFRINYPGKDLLHSDNLFLDLRTGNFTSTQPNHAYFLGKELAQTTAEILLTRFPADLAAIKLSQAIRRQLLHAYLDFYRFQIPEMGLIKTLKVMEVVFG